MPRQSSTPPDDRPPPRPGGLIDRIRLGIALLIVVIVTLIGPGVAIAIWFVPDDVRGWFMGLGAVVGGWCAVGYLDDARFRHRWRGRVASGRCPRCGYDVADLTPIRAGSRRVICPECAAPALTARRGPRCPRPRAGSPAGG